jgi:hypothetical protein
VDWQRALGLLARRVPLEQEGGSEAAPPDAQLLVEVRGGKPNAALAAEADLAAGDLEPRGLKGHLHSTTKYAGPRFNRATFARDDGVSRRHGERIARLQRASQRDAAGQAAEQNELDHVLDHVRTQDVLVEAVRLEQGAAERRPKAAAGSLRRGGVDHLPVAEELRVRARVHALHRVRLLSSLHQIKDPLSLFWRRLGAPVSVSDGNEQLRSAG